MNHITIGLYDDADDRDRARLNAYLRGRLLVRSGGDARDLPAARIVHITARPTTRVVVVECPFAHLHQSKRAGHEFHVHGWPHGQKTPGTRVPHCDHAPDGFYRLELADGMTVPLNLGDSTRAHDDARLDRFLRTRTP